jgi:hypothetical protein
VPPQFASKIRQPCQVVNKVPPTIKRGKWIDYSLEEATKAVEKGIDIH